MPIYSVPVDAWIEQAIPAANHGELSYISLNGDGADGRRGLVFYEPPFDLDDRPSMSKLRFFTYGAINGTITAKRITEPWDESTVNWTNQPATTATNQGSVVVNVASGVQIEIDLLAMMADVAAGAPFYGVLLTFSGAADRFLVSSNNPNENLRPEVEIEWTVVSEPPDNLAPAGGLVVSSNKPYLTWQWAPDDDDDAEVLQARSWVQIDDDPLFGSPAYDSGDQANTINGWDLAATAYGGLTPGTTYYWRAKVKSSAGVWTEWSDAAEFSYVAPGALTVAYPAAGADPTVETLTPTIEFSRSVTTQAHAELVVVKVDEQDPDDSDDEVPFPDEAPEDPEPDVDEDESEEGITENPTWGDPTIDKPPPEEVYRFPKVPTTTGEVAIPEDTIDASGIYQLAVRSWDDEDREQLPGDPGHLEVIRQFRYVKPANTIVPITDLTVETKGPKVILEWSYPEGEVLNYFCLKVDGKEVRSRLEVQDVRIGATQNFRYVYWKARPRIRHKYVIEAVKAVDVGGGKLRHRHSRGNRRRYAVTRPVGIYLIDPSLDIMVRVRGLDAPDMAWREVGTTYDIPGSPVPRRIREVKGGYGGMVRGHVRGMTQRDLFEKIKDRSFKRKMRLAFSDLNFPVELEEASCVPSAEIPPGTVKYDVTFGFFQSGEFVWKAN